MPEKPSRLCPFQNGLFMGSDTSEKIGNDYNSSELNISYLFFKFNMKTKISQISIEFQSFSRFSFETCIKLEIENGFNR